MPKVKERDQTDKVKGKNKKKSSGTAQQQAQRIMTAKLKKELVQQKRGGGDSAAEIPDNITDITTTANTTTGSASADSSTEAVEQVEQATHASTIEVHHYAKRGVSMVVSKVKQERQKIKERQPDTQDQPPDTSAPVPDAPEADTPADTPARPRSRRAADAPDTPQAPPPGERMRQRAAGQRREQLAHPRPDTTIREEAPPGSPRTDTPASLGQTMDTPAAPSGPTPGDRMLQRAVDQRKEQLTHPRADVTIRGEAPASPHYGGPPSTPGPSTKNLPAGDQSIYPSIKERPRRSTVLKEKPQAGAI